MDKFGIFNLINALLPKDGESKTENLSDKTDTENAISSLFSSIKNNFSGKTDAPLKPEKSTQRVPKSVPPLQTKMLSTMNSHDEFIKRVKEKHPTV